MWKKTDITTFRTLKICAVIGLIIMAICLITNIDAPVVSNQSYSELVAEGAETAGYKILQTKPEILCFKDICDFKFIIDYNGQPKTIVVDKATFNMYQVGDYVTCAYHVTGNDVVIAAKPIGEKAGN